jgi:hypothetical protein
VDIIRFEFPILGHPLMRLEPGFIEMVCFSSISLFGRPFSACLVLSAEICSLASLPEPPMRHYRKMQL